MEMKDGTDKSRFNGCSCGRVNSGYYIFVLFTQNECQNEMDFAKWNELWKMKDEQWQLKVKWNMIMKDGTERSRFNGCSCGRVNSGYYNFIVFTKKMNVKMRCT